MGEYSVAVFGGGSVGLCLAATLAEAGARVILLVRGTSVEKLSGRAIEVDGMLGSYRIPPDRLRLCDAATPDEDVRSCDMLLLTTKAYDVEDALRPFAGTGPCPPVMLLQNGMGSAEIARSVLGPDTPIYSTAMMVGMVRHAPTAVSITAQASPIMCGALLGGSESPLFQFLHVAEGGFVPMAHDPTIRETMAFKLLFNSCMNPTGALTGQTYGELLENPDSRTLLVGLADETLAAFSEAFDYRPAENGQHYVDEILSKIVLPRSGGHHSSMLQDLRAGRKTEIDFLNGAIIRLAESVGQSTVRHCFLRSMVKACENGTTAGLPAT